MKKRRFKITESQLATILEAQERTLFSDNNYNQLFTTELDDVDLWGLDNLFPNNETDVYNLKAKLEYYITFEARKQGLSGLSIDPKSCTVWGELRIGTDSNTQNVDFQFKYTKEGLIHNTLQDIGDNNITILPLPTAVTWDTENVHTLSEGNLYVVSAEVDITKPENVKITFVY